MTKAHIASRYESTVYHGVASFKFASTALARAVAKPLDRMHLRRDSWTQAR